MQYAIPFPAERALWRENRPSWVRRIVTATVILAMLTSVAVIATQIHDVKPAAAASCPSPALDPKFGFAPCLPYAAPWYSAAAYMCVISQGNYNGNWPSLRTCQDFYLATHVHDNVTRGLYVIDLYKYYGPDTVVWNRIVWWSNVYLYLFLSTTDAIYLSACAGVGAVYGALAGWGCDRAWEVFRSSYYPSRAYF